MTEVLDQLHSPRLDAGKCKHCKALIVWATTIRGKRIALDAETSQAPSGAHYVVDAKGFAYGVYQGELYRVHADNCQVQKEQSMKRMVDSATTVGIS